MPIDWSPCVEFIGRNDDFLLMTHIRPDADGLGSQLALQDALTQLGKRSTVAIASVLPPRYRFLDPDGSRIVQFHAEDVDRWRHAKAVIVMDTGTWNQLGDFGPFLQTLDVPKAVIDHHRTQDDLGGQRFLDITAEATGRLIYELTISLGLSPGTAAAHNLFMALALDTGWFRHPNTTAASFELAEILVRAGANPPPLYEQLFECAPMARLRLVGVALERLKTASNGLVAYTEILLSDYAETGAVPGDTEDLINYPRSVDGVEVALVFIEQPEGGTKISFRARSKVDVSKIAERFGGGGHKLASGARDDRAIDVVREDVLKVVDEALLLASP